MKVLLQIILILLIISTVSICAIKPDMHKSVIVYDSAYTIVPERQIEIEKETIPIMEKPVEQVAVIKVSETPKVVEVKQLKTEPAKSSVTKQTKQTTVQTKTSQTPKSSQTKAIQTTVSKPKTEVIKQETKATSSVVPIKESVTVPKQKIVHQVESPKVLTQKEEEIAWNTWRSNLQNRIMQDVKLPLIPNGVVFKFSFTVDKFGKVSNVQTWSTTSTYTPYAIQYIAPVIRSYQGKSVLNFPSGTSRITTNVTGGWRISENERYSTPQDYNDIEKIKK